MECVGSRHVKQFPLPVKPNVARVHDGTLESVQIAESVLTAMALKSDAMQSLNLFAREKARLAHWLSFSMSFSCRSKIRLADSLNVSAGMVRAPRSDFTSSRKSMTLACSSFGRALI